MIGSNLLRVMEWRANLTRLKLQNKRLIIRLPAALDSVQELLDRLENHAEEAALPAGIVHRLALICEELAANVAMHGAASGGRATYFEISVEIATNYINIEIEDDGDSFNPLLHAAPDTALGLSGRGIGGLGIHLVRRLVRTIEYARAHSLNRLTMTLDTSV